MVQVLPAVPSFGTQLAQVLTQAGTDVAKGYSKYRARTALDKLLNSEATEQTNQDGVTPSKDGAAPPTPGTPPNPTPSSKINPMKYGAIYDAALEANDGDSAAATMVVNAKIAQDKEAAKDARAIAAEDRALRAPGLKTFYEEIESQRQRLPEQEAASQAIVHAINTGQTGVFSSANIGSFLESLGAPEEIRKALETPGSKEFRSASKTFIASDMRDTFKGNTTGREIEIAEQIGAELGVNENANLAASFYRQLKINITKEKIRLVDELTERGVSPSKIPSVVYKMLNPYIEEEKRQYFEAVGELGFK